LEIPNFPKTSKKWRTIRTSEIRKYSFRLENRTESSAKSSECRALMNMIYDSSDGRPFWKKNTPNFFSLFLHLNAAS